MNEKITRNRSMSDVRIFAWELAGFAFIVILGIPLHSGFAWCGHYPGIAWLTPVNESTWEHFKLCFWPGLVFALVEMKAFGATADSFWRAKALGLLSMPVAIILFFYGYTAFLGHHVLAADILIFIAAVAIGQAISYRFLKSAASRSRWWSTVVTALALAFVWFTYDPPRLFLFKDPITGEYGISEQQDQTLGAARDIQRKVEDSRFVKADRGLFAIKK